MTASGSTVPERLDALDRVLTLARGRLDPAALARAESVAGKAGERLRFGPAHTVVALAGATGSGKSSLFNAVTGQDLSRVGMRRPTTGTAHAAVWGSRDAGELLDWLDVPRRHLLGDRTDPGTDGLVLLDLPDVDSVEVRHRLRADRLVERVDMLVWVFDPQKYADAAVHDRYLVPLAGHADVMLVVLNQVDRLGDAARRGCVADLGRLLCAEGLPGVRVLPASARTGEGIEALRAELAARVAARRAAVRRLEADLSAVADALDGCCGVDGARPGPGGGPGAGPRERAALVEALGEAAGVATVVAAVAATHRARARGATGWPLTRWTRRLRADPALRLRLRDRPSELVRTSLPGPSAVQRARVDSALRELADRASDGLSEPWPTAVRTAATRSRSRLPDLLDRAVAGADLGLDRWPRWWRVVGALQLLLAAAAGLGTLWLLALFGVAWLQLPPPPLPRWGPVPVPTVMLGGGIVLGLLLAAASAVPAGIGATRRARRARRRLDERVEQVARGAVLEPVEAELAAHRELCRALARVRG